MNERKQRIGENEAIFRLFNEEVGTLTKTFTVAAETMTVVCECGVRSCASRFQISPEKYASVRADSALFVLRPGHDIPEAETVVEQREDYWIVRKHPGEPEHLARETDPRE